MNGNTKGSLSDSTWFFLSSEENWPNISGIHCESVGDVSRILCHVIMCSCAFLLTFTAFCWSGWSPHCSLNVWVLSHFSHVQLFATLWTIVRQAPLPMEILQVRILQWVASIPGIFPPVASELQIDSLPLSHQGGPAHWIPHAYSFFYVLVQTISLPRMFFLLTTYPDSYSHTVIRWQNWSQNLFLFSSNLIP